MLKTWVHSTNYMTEKADDLREACKNEEGEVASWLILAAGLALAAVAASGVLQGIISTLAAKVGTDAGVGGGGGATGGGGGNITVQ